MKSGLANGLRGIVALALLTGAVATRAQTPQDSSVAGVEPEEPKIVAIRIVKEDGQVLSDSPLGIAVETGKAVDRGKIAESLRALYRAGDYADLRAVTTPVPDGVRLDFVVRENMFFNQVRIQGLPAPPSEASAAAAMQIELGQSYRQAAVNEALERLRETLRDEGLYRAEVSAETVPHPETHQMDIVVHVKPGPRARVGIIQLKNGTEYRDAEILSRLKMKAGSQITSAKLQRGTGRIRKYLVKKGHLSGRAGVHRGNYDASKKPIANFRRRFRFTGTLQPKAGRFRRAIDAQSLSGERVSRCQGRATDRRQLQGQRGRFADPLRGSGREADARRFPHDRGESRLQGR